MISFKKIDYYWNILILVFCLMFLTIYDVSANSDTKDLNLLLSTNERVIELPKDRVFVIDSSIYIKSNKIIKGNGAVLMPLDSLVKMIILENVTNIKFENLYFKGTTEREIRQAAIWLNNASKIEFINCTFDSESDVKGFNQAIYCIKGCDDLVVKNCVFRNIRGVNSGNGYSIHLAYTKGALISGNLFESRIGDGRHAVYLSSGTKNSIVEGNRIYNYECGAISIYSYFYQVSTEYNIVRKNLIYGGTNRYDFDASITVFQNCNNNSIIDNTIVKSGNYSILLSGDDRNEPNSLCSNNSIVSNRIDSSYYAGIAAWGVKNVSILNNKIRNTNWSRRRRKSFAIGIFDDVNYFGLNKGAFLEANNLLNNKNTDCSIKIITELKDVILKDNKIDSPNCIKYTNYFRMWIRYEKHQNLILSLILFLAILLIFVRLKIRG